MYTDLVAEEAVQFITGHAIKSFFLMKAKATQLAGLLMMIQTMHLINFDCDQKVRPVQTCKSLTNYKNKWKGFSNKMKLTQPSG